MDILRFINSKDIREYLKKIKYKFNSLEAAWLIYQCRDASINEKHKAWEELIDTMPDCEIKYRGFNTTYKSLHNFLKDYTELENELLKEFINEHHADTFDENRPYVYSFKHKTKDDEYFPVETVFSRIDALYESDLKPEDDVILIKCKKMRLDSSIRPDIAYISPGFDIMKIEPVIKDEEKNNLFYGVFDYLYFEFPTPFKKGDIVWDPQTKHGSLCGGPFVLTGISGKGKKRIYADTSDMNAWGYFLNKDGGTYHEVMWNYMDLEYYTDKFEGDIKALLPISNYLKNNNYENDNIIQTTEKEQ